MDSLPSRLCILFIFMLISAYAKLASKALDNANEARLQKLADSGNKRASLVIALNDDPIKLHNVTNALITACVCASSVFVSRYLLIPLESHRLSVAVTLLVYLILQLVFCVYIPSRLAIKKAKSISLALSGSVKVLITIMTPFIFPLTFISNQTVRLLGINPDHIEEEVTEEEILHMVESGTIDPEEKEMINNIFEFDDTLAKEIMTHRTDVDLLWLEDDIDAWDEQIMESNHTYYPVCGNSVDNIVGILNSNKFYRLLRKHENIDKNALLESAFLVPDTIKADELFRQMQTTRTHFALVLDEYGGLGGIITISDLLEEIVGTLADDNSPDEDIRKNSDNSWTIMGSADIDLVSETLGIDLPVDEYNTFAGMILAELGSIPDDGETPELEAYGLQIKVLSIKDHRIEEAKVAFTDPEPQKETE